MRFRWASSLESFRLGRLRVYEYEILRKSFFRVLSKNIQPGKLHFNIFHFKN